MDNAYRRQIRESLARWLYLRNETYPCDHGYTTAELDQRIAACTAYLMEDHEHERNESAAR